ncbi:hypothetical protein BS50DRAFT_474325, partial [Corynespora cassiicola Philippines]
LTVVEHVKDVASFENLAVRSNGNILLTSLNSPSLYQISPNKTLPPISVATIPGLTGLLGIAELEKDIFYVVASNFTPPNVVTADGTNEIWKVDLRSSANLDPNEQYWAYHQGPRISLIARIPSAGLLNGLCRLSPQDTATLLVADSLAGTVVKVDTKTGRSSIILQDELMTSTSTGFQLGINGLHALGDRLFFTNYNRGLFASIPINTSSGLATGPVDIIVNGTAGDDFVLSSDGKQAWIAMNGINTLMEIDVAKKTSRVVANSTLLTSSTAVSLGRTGVDRKNLYVTCSAAVGNSTVGSVVRADLP